MASKKKRGTKKSYKSPEMLAVEEETGHLMTLMQKTFAERFVEGNCTATQAAIEAGYSPRSAPNIAGQLLNPRITPQVVEYISRMRDQMAAKYGVSKEGMLQRLYTLSRGAEEAGQYSAAINAEKIRASLAGLTIDRRETVSTVDGMTKEQVIQRLEDLKKRHPAAFDIIEGTYTEPVTISDEMLKDVTPDD
jgi:phage terminase small subunit